MGVLNQRFRQVINFVKINFFINAGECKIGRPSGEQEPRGVSVSRCKACWLRICLHKFVLDNKSKEVIEKYYAPKFASNLKAAKAATATCTTTNTPGLLPAPLASRSGSFTELVQAPAADAPPLPGASIRKRRSAPAELNVNTNSNTLPGIAASATATSDFNQTSYTSSASPTKPTIPGGNRCTVRRVAARRKDFGRFEIGPNGPSNKRSNKRTKEIYGTQSGQPRRLRRAVLPSLDRDSDSADEHSYRADMEEEFAHRRIGAYHLEPMRRTDAEEFCCLERESKLHPEKTEFGEDSTIGRRPDENNGPVGGEECGKCSYCVSGRSSNVLVLKESCKYVGLPRPKSCSDTSSRSDRSNCTSHWDDNGTIGGFHTVEYYGGARAALSESIVRRATKRETPTSATTTTIDGEPLLWVRTTELKPETATTGLGFEKPAKKIKKRKTPAGGSSIKKGGLFKKNMSFLTDYVFLNEILNANSPFL